MTGRLMLAGAVGALVLLAWVPGVEAGLSIPSGYTLSAVLSVPPTAFLGGLDYLSTGELVYFDGTKVTKYSGGVYTPLFDPPGTVFGSFVKVVGGSTIYFGESTNMKIYQVASGGGGTHVAQVQYNFDLENYGSQLYVSYNASTAPPPGRPDAAVAKLTVPGGALDVILGDTDGFSGPLTFDPSGNLYYCVPNPNFGQPGVEGLYFFTRAQVLSAIGAGELRLNHGTFLGMTWPDVTTWNMTRKWEGSSSPPETISESRSKCTMSDPARFRRSPRRLRVPFGAPICAHSCPKSVLGK